MATIKLAPLCAAVAITASGVLLIASPSAAKELPVVVQGEPIQEATVQRVSYADLTLADAIGEKVLKRRVERAVNEVCATANAGGHFTDRWMCQDLSWDDARPQIKRAIAQARGTVLAGAPVEMTIKVAARR